ncbi:hypothetical protein BJ742DRAFT_205017 [Cladochytrium replicatum]|nr:hypothetical protein BJ742DRAFT_205017 [Cladochytrium replicatum]
MGKSSVALQFAKLHQKSYDSMFWIPCNTAATAVSALRAYAESRFGLVGFESMDSADIVSFMGDKLTKFHRYLLILDNVDDESVLDQILVSTLTGDVVVTSRSNAGLTVKMQKWIDPLAKNVRFDYLTVDQNEVDALNKLIQHIDGLPLAAEQAAAFMEREQTNFSVLVRHITSYLAESPDPRLGVASVSLVAIIRAGLDTIGNAASLLMQVLSFYASLDIPFDLVDQVVLLLSEGEVEGIQKTDFNTQVLLRKLRSQLLLYDSPNNMLSTHQLIQQVVSSVSLPSTRPKFSQVSLNSLVNVFLKEVDGQFESSKIPLARALLSHVAAVSESIPPDSVDHSSELFDPLDDLQWQCQSFCSFVGYFSQQIDLLEELLTSRTAHYNTREHASVGTILHNMGEVADSQGEYAKAMQLYEESLATYFKVYGTQEHASVATTLNNMGQVAFSQGEYAKAMQLYEEDLAISVKVYGTREHASVATTLNNMGQVASSQGEYAKAMQLYEESVAIEVKVYGTREHDSVATTLHSMSVCKNNMGDIIGAHECANEALQIYRSCLPPSHHQIK